MLLQSTISQSPLQHPHVSHSSNLSYSLSYPSGFRSSVFLRTIRTYKIPIVRCSISQVHSYGSVDYERRPMAKWSSILKGISSMEDPEMGAASVLNQCETQGKLLTKWELSKIVRELRRFNRFKLALEVYEWMSNRPERFTISSSDTAIQLDLISKVHGVLNAEDYFMKLPDKLKDKRTYGSLLNAYTWAKMRGKAESLFENMKVKGYDAHPLMFNVMMTLYKKLKNYDKVESLVSDMREKNIRLDTYSYNIWLSSCGYQGSVEKMEQVFEQMQQDSSINPNWTTFSTMATVYITLGKLEQAEDCLKKVENRITGRDRIPFHYLVSLYGSVGKKEEVYRVWNLYKSLFQKIPNLGYHTMISSLVRLADIEGAEQLFEEWLSVKSKYDPRVVNLLMGWYARNGLLEKAKSMFDRMVEGGGKPNSRSWEVLVEGYLGERRISAALPCLKEAVCVGSNRWKPKPVNVNSMLKICEQEDDQASKDVLVGILRQAGCFEDKTYMSHIPFTNGVAAGGVLAAENRTDDEFDEDGDEMILNELQGSF